MYDIVMQNNRFQIYGPEPDLSAAIDVLIEMLWEDVRCAVYTKYWLREINENSRGILSAVVLPFRKGLYKSKTIQGAPTYEWIEVENARTLSSVDAAEHEPNVPYSGHTANIGEKLVYAQDGIRAQPPLNHEDWLLMARGVIAEGLAINKQRFAVFSEYANNSGLNLWCEKYDFAGVVPRLFFAFNGLEPAGMASILDQNNIWGWRHIYIVQGYFTNLCVSTANPADTRDKACIAAI